MCNSLSRSLIAETRARYGGDGARCVELVGALRENASRGSRHEAGIYPDNTLLDIPGASWDTALDTNLKGTFLCTQRFARVRIRAGGGGAIVNLASTAAFSARIGAAHYGASKAGMVMLTRSMAQERGPHGIRVNAVAPGLIEVEARRLAPDYKRSFLPMIPLGRIGRPRDVADAVAFLISERVQAGLAPERRRGHRGCRPVAIDAEKLGPIAALVAPSSSAAIAPLSVCPRRS